MNLRTSRACPACRATDAALATPAYHAEQAASLERLAERHTLAARGSRLAARAESERAGARTERETADRYRVVALAAYAGDHDGPHPSTVTAWREAQLRGRAEDIPNGVPPLSDATEER